MFLPLLTVPPQSEDTDGPDHSPSVSSDDTLGLHPSATGGSANILLKVPGEEGGNNLNGTNKILSVSDSGEDTDEGV